MIHELYIAFINPCQLYQQNMFKTSNLLQQIAHKITNLHHYRNILRKQNQIFLLDSLQLENCPPEYILKIYQIIPSRFKANSQSSQSSNRWFQYEKKIFAWFIICYTHFLKEDKCQPLNQAFWSSISPIFFYKLPQFLHFQYLNLIRPTERVIWEENEDQLLLQCLGTERVGKWSQISRNMFYLSKCKIFKSPKNCRERWHNHLDTSKIRGKWTEQQDLFIIRFVIENGKRWSKLTAKMLNTRTENMVKNRFNSLVFKFHMNKREKECDFFRRVLEIYENKLVQGQVKIPNILNEKQNQIKNNCHHSSNNYSSPLIKTNNLEQNLMQDEKIQNSNWTFMLNSNIQSQIYLNGTQYIGCSTPSQVVYQINEQIPPQFYFYYPIMPTLTATMGTLY